MKIFAHRGASNYASENTLEAFVLAIEMGADGVELDIQLSKDGEIVVIHDETIDRTTKGCGYVKDYTAKELSAYNIPMLADVLAILKPTDMQINIELKTNIIFYQGIEEKAYEMVCMADMNEQIIWSSFNHYSLKRIKQLSPVADIALLSGGIYVTAAQCLAMGATALHPHINQLHYPDLVADCIDNGIIIRTYTINSRERLELAIQSGCEAVFSDVIDFA